MVQGVTGSFQLMKSLNRSLVLNIIRQKGPISRTDVSKQAGLTPPTVSNIVLELLEEGMVREETGESNGGRKPILLSINYNNHFVIGIDVGTNQLRVGLTNLNAGIKEMISHKLPAGMKVDEFMKILISSIHEIFESTSADREKIIGIGIAMHGIVDEEKGESIYAPHFGFENLPLKDRLESEFGLPVKLENDARCAAISETWFGSAQREQNIVCINIGDGIGAGLIINGKVFRGRHHIAGELGHMIVDLSGRKCTCGSYGCLHTVASGIHIREKVIHEITLGRSTLIEQLVTDRGDIDGDVVHKAALQGDAFAISVFEEAGRFLGLACTNIINVMNPDKIILTGGVMKAGDFVMNPLQEFIRQRALTQEAKATSIVRSQLGSHSALLGAVSLVLQEVFEIEA
ncbi:ROK family transcriptional regulator [Alkalicoccus daliensis]|uniref:Transcriptional regulator, MarR family n=1 Tax=Alkalicoccus daliensis TaxID=745820 RepID=A0A1H0L6K2_9BACI|nr:ROK family transcriptional regulator [Alkalicoccus daliensis]SDO63869.1 transcriptional regulator, MarR family [Alkalicoccus daliensis]